MLQPRRNAGGCAFRDKIYVFCGQQGNQILNTIESFCAKFFLEGEENIRWQSVEVSVGGMHACINPVVCQITDKQILVLGGSRNNYKVNEVSVFDTWSQSVDHREMPEFYCEGIGNQSVQSFDGEVTALVKGPENESFLVSYPTRNADINVI